MNRRTLLASTGVAVATAAGAGCLDTPSASYPTQTFGGEDVPLAPLSDVHEWFEADDAQFVDTRPEGEYEAAHIPGAVHSPPSADDAEGTDPTADWDRETRIVTYCSCPHALAVSRASELLADGYEAVFAIDEGFTAWREAGYPLAGEDTDDDPTAYEIAGRSDPAHAGETVELLDPDDGGAYEVAEIDADGRYETTIHSSTLTPDSSIRVVAPDYEVVASLEELTGGTVTAETGESVD